jgi:hypothetical protein
MVLVQHPLWPCRDGEKVGPQRDGSARVTWELKLIITYCIRNMSRQWFSEPHGLMSLNIHNNSSNKGGHRGFYYIHLNSNKADKKDIFIVHSSL